MYLFTKFTNIIMFGTNTASLTIKVSPGNLTVRALFPAPSTALLPITARVGTGTPRVARHFHPTASEYILAPLSSLSLSTARVICLTARRVLFTVSSTTRPEWHLFVCPAYDSIAPSPHLPVFHCSGMPGSHPW